MSDHKRTDADRKHPDHKPKPHHPVGKPKREHEPRTMDNDDIPPIIVPDLPQ